MRKLLTNLAFNFNPRLDARAIAIRLRASARARTGLYSCTINGASCLIGIMQLMKRRRTYVCYRTVHIGSTRDSQLGFLIKKKKKIAKNVFRRGWNFGYCYCCQRVNRAHVRAPIENVRIFFLFSLFIFWNSYFSNMSLFLNCDPIRSKWRYLRHL